MYKIAILVLFVAFFSACGSPPPPPPEPLDAPLKIVATVFPQYDFIRNIAGDRVDLTMLIPPGTDSHYFEPTVQDIAILAEADLLVYVGERSENWLYPTLASIERPDMQTISIIDFVETMQELHFDDEGERVGNSQIDEHIWTSPWNAVSIVEGITDALSQMDPINADFFRQNADTYIRELELLGQSLHTTMNMSARQVVVFGDRFPFLYLTTHLGLTAFAAFDNCSDNMQADPARVAQLIDLVNEQEIPVVFYTEFSDGTIANAIAEATGAELLQIHSAHNLTQEEFEDNVTFLELMWHNIDVLRAALW
ncbi:MAG: metal ABC transporter substrate-binding protein [Turicibacter sp.]|nr:metal ABC transporter substrate-binding protein [Turicibacter sp.]